MNAEITNHHSPSLSDLDMLMVKSIPPGGNWKNIPSTIPSARLEQIRTSYAAGEGSRSTYYGRLHPDSPSYTISTYFNRPGNGCFIHYDGNRLISQREAARLQSFPDSFLFSGSQREINQQIGNAVPPLLAYQIAKSLGEPGSYIDLFSGAGGLSLGFKWAGWQPILANDLSTRFLESYARNVHADVLQGDVSDPEIYTRLINRVREMLTCRPFAILGGPPCQGFSTAGKKRSMSDSRNHLFKSYAGLLSTLKPDIFLFENVTGLANMEGGNVLSSVLQHLSSAGFTANTWKLKAEQYGLPQRRHRLFIAGNPIGGRRFYPPEQITSLDSRLPLLDLLPLPPTVREALGDLPPLSPGKQLDTPSYISEPMNRYQALMRGRITVSEYIEVVKLGCPT